MMLTGICFAQDVLVKKDGSTILAKVLKITETEVEYKDFNNQDGPTRVINIANLLSINYQNGQKESFSIPSSTHESPVQTPDIVTKETVTKFSNDQQLMQMYKSSKQLSPEQMQKKVKKLRIAGWTVGGVLFVGGVVAFGFMHADCDFYGDYHWHAIPLGVGFSSIAAGIATWSGCYFRARKLERRSRYSVQSAPVFQQEFNVGNDRLVVGLDMLKDNTMKNQTLGMGLTYNF